jgi:hypothetical protein
MNDKLRVMDSVHEGDDLGRKRQISLHFVVSWP